MPQAVKVKVQPLTAEAFRPYGVVMQEAKQIIFPEVEEGGRPALEFQRSRPRKNGNNTLAHFAVHFSYRQTFIPVRGSMILVVAPPPRNREAQRQDYELDYERIAAFSLSPGQAADIDKGVWHSAVIPEQECLWVNSTRKDAGEGANTTRVNERGQPEWRDPRPYIEFVDIRERDGRLVEVELS
jgi:ureidoglycolate hydrolase